jgi:hypothetical protein
MLPESDHKEATKKGGGIQPDLWLQEYGDDLFRKLCHAGIPIE